MRSVYEGGGGVEAVLTYAGSYNGRPYPGLHPVQDAQLVAVIAGHFYRLAAIEPGVLALAEPWSG